MSERMPRLIFSIPRKTLDDFKAIVRMDGRSQGEILRSLIFGFVDSKKAQAAIMANLDTRKR